jgi:sulfur-carrier protein adenylyltransferase/sulfurtransferase
MEKTKPSYERYQRQILLKELGEEGQQKLLNSKVIVVGAGGLGCPALQYLVAAGIGQVGIIDDDKVATHNLHRQVLYTTADVGQLKAEAAARRLSLMNPDVRIETHSIRITNQNALTLLKPYDIVLDATDNFATRYLVNDACVLLNKPLIYGAISQYEGQVAIFNAGTPAQRTNYRDLFPKPPQAGSVLNCAEAGVLGVLPGMIGTMQATEVLKLITGIGTTLINQLFTYNALTNQGYVFDIAANKQASSAIPKNAKEFEETDYEWLCNSSGEEASEIDAVEFDVLVQHKDAVVIDVREENELPEVTEFRHLKVPLSTLPSNQPEIQNDTVVLFCQSGKRSKEAAKILSANFGSAKKIYSLKGGILSWKQLQHGKEKA